ncbi:32771_t:CDS:2, partial [Racocetra persica]
MRNYIARFVYNQLDDSSPEEKNKQKTQMKRRIAKKLNKSNESELKEEELNESLYKIEIGEMILDSGLVAIFWKNIKSWWNGPAEEEGESSAEWDEKCPKCGIITYFANKKQRDEMWVGHGLKREVPPNQRGECVICHLEKDIWLISEIQSIENTSIVGDQTPL